jgi:elongation factor P hydroxylase
MLFNRTLGASYATRLVRGGEEPEYIPASDTDGFHQIVFTHDYFSSALHEMAHWCVAGEQRRLQHDYGYWYAPDGRTEQQQADFERVEVKPQALEWLFSVACGIRFRVSADNLESDLGASAAFKAAIVQQVHRYCLGELNGRAYRLFSVLVHFFQHQESQVYENSQKADCMLKTERFLLGDLT